MLVDKPVIFEVITVSLEQEKAGIMEEINGVQTAREEEKEWANGQINDIRQNFQDTKERLTAENSMLSKSSAEKDHTDNQYIPLLPDWNILKHNYYVIYWCKYKRSWTSFT